MSTFKEKITFLFRKFKEGSKLDKSIFICTAIFTTLVIAFTVVVIMRHGDITNELIVKNSNNNDVAANETTTAIIEETTNLNEETELQTMYINGSTIGSYVSNASLLEAKVSVANSWLNSDGFFVQYNVSVSNVSGKDIENWGFAFHFNGNAVLSDSWNGQYEMAGSNLVVHPVAFNHDISKNDDGFSFGFIIKADYEDSSIKSYTVYALDTSETLAVNISIPVPQTTEYTTPVKPETTTEEETTTSDSNQTSNKGPANIYGRLSVSGTKLMSAGVHHEVQLKGISTHGISFFPQYINDSVFSTVASTFNADVIRVPVYTSESGGYCTGGNKDTLKKLVDNAVTYAKDNGLYIIIDWHILSDGNPQTYQTEAIEFFSYVAKKYSSYTNVLYEICNEPNGNVTWSKNIKPYAETLISTIRKYDSEAVILVGTPNWSQDVDVVADDPIVDVKNVMYTFHFYAATHKETYRQKVEYALSKGLPIFVSEFGICDSSGNGNVDEESANEWLSFMNKNGISFVAWNLSNKNESSSILKPGVNSLGGWTVNELTASGQWILNALK